MADRTRGGPGCSRMLRDLEPIFSSGSRCSSAPADAGRAVLGLEDTAAAGAGGALEAGAGPGLLTVAAASCEVVAA